MSYFNSPTQPINAVNPGHFDATPMYAYDPTVTGWVAMSKSDFGGSGSSSGGTGSSSITTFLGVTTLPLPVSGFVTSTSGGYVFNVTGLTSGQLTLAAGTRAYSFAIISGSSTINGLSIPSPIVINGGGYDTRTLTNSITVGTTGGYVLVNWEV